MAVSSEADCAAAILLGEFVQSVYDTINTNDGQFLNLPLYGKSSLFSHADVNLATGGQSDGGQSTARNSVGGDGAAVNLFATTHPYCITRYIYCTVSRSVFFIPTETVWIGYVAESTKKQSKHLGRRDIVVAFRGTASFHELMKDMSFAMSDFPFGPGQPADSPAKVHSGFLSIYTEISTASSSGFGKVSMREQIFREVSRLLKASESSNTLPVRITVTGHSLGGALAMLTAADLGYNIKAVAKTSNVTVCAVTFGAPKVGNHQFKTLVEKHTGFIWRYRSVGDLVPRLPPSVPIFSPYEHAGTKLILDWTLSPYVSTSVKSWKPFGLEGHNLELHLHVLADEGSVAVYNSIELPEILSELSGRSVIAYICSMDAWQDAQDREFLQEELEDVKEKLKDDQEALQLYLREVAYIGIRRSNKLSTAPAPLVAGKSTLLQVPGAAPAADSGHHRAASFNNRDYTLLNKSADILKKEYSVPPNWLVHPNKDMVRVGKKWQPRVNRSSDIPSPGNKEYN